MSRAGKKVRPVTAPVQQLPAKLTAPLRRTSLLTSRSSQEHSLGLSRALRRILSSVRAVIHLASGGERVVLTPSLSRADLKTQTQFAHRTDGKVRLLGPLTRKVTLSGLSRSRLDSGQSRSRRMLVKASSVSTLALEHW